jgi:hypothetical protein
LTDKRDLLSYMLFVLDEESFEDLVGELTSVEGVDINELFPYC